MLSRLAKFVSRHAKVILAIWVVAILIIFPTAFKSFESTELSLNGMDKDGSESAEGKEILEKYFHDTGIGDNPILVLGYDSPSGYKQFVGDGKTSNISDYIIKWFQDSIVWKHKLVENNGIYVLDWSVNENSGLVALGFTYGSGYDFDRITEDTGNLRSEVDKAIESYLSELGVTTKHFNSYVTGNSALLYDMSTDINDTLTGATIVVLAIAIILMGVFFGSVMTSIISVVNIAFSTVIGMFLMYWASQVLSIPSVSWLIAQLICVVMSFAFCVLFISVYRRNILAGMGKDESLEQTIVKTGKVYVYPALCVILMSVVLLFSNSVILDSLGVCLIIATVSILSVSLIVPATLIAVTKNELFWTRSGDGTFKNRIVNRYYSSVDGAFEKVSSFSDHYSRNRCIAIISVVALITVGSVAYIAVSDLHSEDFDLTDSVKTGDSAEGVTELENHQMGGLFQPYSIVLKGSSELGVIEKETEGIIFEHEYYVINWGSNAADVYKELQSLKASVLACDTDNIYSVTTIEMWDQLVQKAKDSGITDPDKIIEAISDGLKISNIIAYQGLQEELEDLKPLFTSYYIVEYCGPVIDFAMNSWLTDIGYETKSDGRNVIDYVALSAFTKKTATSDRLMSTTDKVDSAVDSFMTGSKCFSKSWVTGLPVSYKEVYGGLTGNFAILLCIVLVIIFAVFYVSQRELSVPIAIFITSAISMFISLAIFFAASSAFKGTISESMLYLMPLFTVTFSIWFAYLQIAMMRDCGSISEMKRAFNPVIIVTSLVVALGSLLLCFSNVTLIAEMGFAVAVMVLVDAFIVRLLLSPAVWQFGINHRIRFFERYSDE